MPDVAIAASGHRIGESHHKVTVTDHEVDLMLELRDMGYSYAWLAEKFECSKSTAYGICTGRTRAQIPARYKRVPA